MLDAGVKVGVKRKLEEASLLEACYHEERQAILNVSMYKLKTFSSSRVEPSLLRSVLIYNTLKYIEQELNNEGLSVPNLATPVSLTPQGDTLDPIPSDPKLVKNYHSKPEDCEPSEKVAKLDFNSNRRTERTESRSEAREVRSETRTDDDMLADIDVDLALYDFDLFSPKLPPISADELVHVIPPDHPAAGYYNSPYGAAGFPAGGSCKTDLICDDLDHIMQVLVGM